VFESGSSLGDRDGGSIPPPLTNNLSAGRLKAGHVYLVRLFSRMFRVGSRETEERKEWRRKWTKANPDKIKGYRKERRERFEREFSSGIGIRAKEKSVV